MSTEGNADVSLLELFRQEAETQTQALIAGLLALERDHSASRELEACMRAAHSLKGAASIVGLAAGVRVAHSMEDCLVAALKGRTTLRQAQIDLLLDATDLLSRIATTPEADIDIWSDHKKPDVDGCVEGLAGILQGEAPAVAVPQSEPAPQTTPRRRATDDEPADVGDRVLRVTAENLNRLLGLAGESLVESRWVQPFAQSLLRLRRLQRSSSLALDTVRDLVSPRAVDERLLTAVADAQRLILECEELLAERLHDLDMFDRRSINLSNRLYDEALTCRMRPFADGIQGVPRMVRDVARSLGKKVRVEILGETTQVDREILARLDAPLGHLLRNALDHGIESPEERHAARKPSEGVLRLEARHSGGALHVSVSDDGRGIDLDKLRAAVVQRKLIDANGAASLSEAELLEFLFLPGFSMKGAVTEISGRGVGLDVVQEMIKQVRGTVRVFSQAGLGTRFELQLPVALSVVRTLLAEIGGEPYAFPLAHLIRALNVPRDRIELLEGRQHIDFDGRRIGLVDARQVFETAEGSPGGAELSVIVLGDASHTYGLVVERFLGKRELVVQSLESQLGKIRDISAAALMPDGSPVLIVDTEDLIRSIDKLVGVGRLNRVAPDPAASGVRRRKRVLVVDDSLTVREVERKLLGNRGYDVEVAVDGMDGWNAVRSGHFDLVVTDIDMPRMDGIELVSLINKDPHLKAIPVMVVSYKDREEDRRRGLEAGAAHYLTKGSFHDETLIKAVVDLIGEAA